MSAKRKKKLKERAKRRTSPQNCIVSARVLTVDMMNIHREVEYIVKCAQAGDARCVTIRSLLLFSTQAGDAWLLEPKDQLALCLARDGEAQAVQLVDTETQFYVGWDKSFEIRESLFATLDHKTGRTTVITGYPIPAILEAIDRCYA